MRPVTLHVTSLGALVLLAVCADSRRIAARQQACADQARQRAVINVARMINTLEINHRPLIPYQPLSAFPQLAVPAGMVVQFAVDRGGSGYVFTVKDARDPCGFAVFSDQDGVIYRAQPLQ
jgi:hypothetical protein